MKKENLENQEELLNKEEIENNQDNENSQTEASEKTEEDKVEDLGTKLTEINDKYLRLYSDFENFRKRTSKEKLDMMMFASEDTIKVLLPFVDDFERMINDFKSQESIPDSTKEGMMLVYNKLNTFLTSKGVKKIEAKGEKFDANLHEAVTQFPAQDESQKGIVIDEIETGYFMHEKVIRYSKVVVAI